MAQQGNRRVRASEERRHEKVLKYDRGRAVYIRVLRASQYYDVFFLFTQTLLYSPPRSASCLATIVS
jgi:hypothetical protein